MAVSDLHTLTTWCYINLYYYYLIYLPTRTKPQALNIVISIGERLPYPYCTTRNFCWISNNRSGVASIHWHFSSSTNVVILPYWVQVICLCSQGLARYHVTTPYCSIALAPKLCATEKLVPSHLLRLRRFFFPDWQRVCKLTCSEGPRFRLRWVQRGTDFQCWHILSLCKKRQALLQHLWTQLCRIQTVGMWQLHPRLPAHTCCCSLERVIIIFCPR